MKRWRPWAATPSMGYKAIRAQCRVPGLEHSYGVGRGDLYYEPAEKGFPPETRWSSERYLSFVPSLFERLRREFGADVHLLHDVHHRLTPIEAARLGKSLEPYHLFWLEDPTPAEEQARFRLIRQHTTTPLAVGEIFNSIHDCSQLISEQLIDYIRTTVVRAGGISHLRKIATFAELYQVRTGSHGATDLSPVCMAAALHFDLSVHNFGVQEYMRHSEETDRVFPHAYTFTDGFMHPATSRDWASRSTRRWRRHTRMSARTSGEPFAGRHHAQLVNHETTRHRFATRHSHTAGLAFADGPRLLRRARSAEVREVIAAPGDIQFGYAAITWQGQDRQAIEDVAAVGFKGIQLRTSALPEFGDKPAALKELLAKHRPDDGGVLERQRANRSAVRSRGHRHPREARAIRSRRGREVTCS